jgi:hypothetical protein
MLKISRLGAKFFQKLCHISHILNGFNAKFSSPIHRECGEKVKLGLIQVKTDLKNII